MHGWAYEIRYEMQRFPTDSMSSLMCLSFKLKMLNHSSMSSTQLEADSSPCSTCRNRNIQLSLIIIKITIIEVDTINFVSKALFYDLKKLNLGEDMRHDCVIHQYWQSLKLYAYYELISYLKKNTHGHANTYYNIVYKEKE